MYARIKGTNQVLDMLALNDTPVGTYKVVGWEHTTRSRLSGRFIYVRITLFTGERFLAYCIAKDYAICRLR